MVLTEKAEWKALQKHYEGEAQLFRVRKLFEDDPNRFDKFR